MTEKVKTVIGCFFLLPDFQSRGHPVYFFKDCLLPLEVCLQDLMRSFSGDMQTDGLIF